MKRTIGVLATRHIWVGNGGRPRAHRTRLCIPSPGGGVWDMRSMPARADCGNHPEQIAAADQAKTSGGGRRRLSGHHAGRRGGGVPELSADEGISIWRWR